jgi:hypothetical protein
VYFECFKVFTKKVSTLSRQWEKGSVVEDIIYFASASRRLNSRSVGGGRQEVNGFEKERIPRNKRGYQETRREPVVEGGGRRSRGSRTAIKRSIGMMMMMKKKNPKGRTVFLCRPRFLLFRKLSCQGLVFPDCLD